MFTAASYFEQEDQNDQKGSAIMQRKAKYPGWGCYYIKRAASIASLQP
jgi:hypothetical protein